MKKKMLTNFILGFMLLSLIGCAAKQKPAASLSTTKKVAATKRSYNPNRKISQGNTVAYWDTLQRTSSLKLTEMLRLPQTPLQLGWIELALLIKQKNLSNPILAQKLIAWRQHYPLHPANQLIPNNQTLMQLKKLTPPQQIAVLLPQSGPYAKSGAYVREGFLNAYYANSDKVNNQRIKFYDTQQASSITALYQQAIKEGADFVIGPLTKPNVQELSAMDTFTVPTLALNYSESVKNGLPNNLYQYGLLPSDEAAQIAIKASNTGLKHGIIIAPQNPWGHRLAAEFRKQWKSSGGDIVDTWFYSDPKTYNQEMAYLLKIDPRADRKLAQTSANNKTLLSQQRRQDFDVIFLFAQPKAAHAIVPLLRFYYVANVPVFATSSIYRGQLNAKRDTDLNGIIVCDIPQNLAKPNASSDRLHAVGQDTYMLSQSLARLTQLNNFPIYGATGALSLTSERQIHRRLPCMQIKNGFIA